MTEVVLYHHVQGLTEGVRSFADELRQARHTVHTPDLFDGRTFDKIEEGMAFAREAGFGALAERGVAAAEGIAPEAVYAGFSFGVMVAQQLAQTRPGARGALLMYSCLPVSEFGDAWPERVPVQVHGKDADPFFAEDHRGRAGPRRLDRPGRAVPLPGGGAPFRRLVAPGVRRRRCGVAHRARARVPRHGPGRHGRTERPPSAARSSPLNPSSPCHRRYKIATLTQPVATSRDTTFPSQIWCSRVLSCRVVRRGRLRAIERRPQGLPAQQP